jgi:basic membrane lipoprotein Med (substrate-binding protein (PBP1-ABC) superfamily)
MTHRSLWAALAGLVWLVQGCTLAAPADIRAGVGSACQADSDCQAAKCNFTSSGTSQGFGICATSCVADTDCPTGTVCAKSLCQQPLAVGVALTGAVTELEGWTFAHVSGLDAASKELGYVRLDKRFGLTPGNVLPDITEIANSNQLILGNTVDYLTDFKAAAAALPDKKFVCVDDGVYMLKQQNLRTYWIHRVLAWYLAGQVAAGTANKRLGVISAFINPETVADVNAFTLGARSIKKDLIVEVRHMGFWFDTETLPTYKYKDRLGVTNNYYREEYLAALMVDSGCEVIAHLGNTQRPVRLIEKLVNSKYTTGPVYSFANDNQAGYLDAGGQPLKSCLGSIYENWFTLYRDLFESLHRNSFGPQTSFDYDMDLTTDSPTGVSVNPAAPVDSVAVRTLTQNLLRIKDPAPRRRIFGGPYKINGQRDKNGDGLPDPASEQEVAADVVLDPQETANMCWYVEGVVEKKDRENPLSADVPALVPGGLVPGATTPGSSVPYGSYSTDKLVIPAGLSAECRKNAFGSPS